MRVTCGLLARKVLISELHCVLFEDQALTMNSMGISAQSGTLVYGLFPSPLPPTHLVFFYAFCFLDSQYSHTRQCTYMRSSTRTM